MTETIFSLFPFRFVWLPVFLAPARLALVATADDLGAPAIEPVQENLKDKPGHGADLVPDDETRDVLLAHAVGRLVVLTAPSEEAVVGLGFGPSGSHCFGEEVSWGEYEGVCRPKEFNSGSRGFCAVPAAVEIAQPVSGQGVIVARGC